MQQNDRPRPKTAHHPRQDLFRISNDRVQAADGPADDLQIQIPCAARKVFGDWTTRPADENKRVNCPDVLAIDFLRAPGSVPARSRATRIEVGEIAVRIGVVFQQMSLAGDLRREFGVGLHPLADAEESGFDVRLAQYFKQPGCGTRVGPVVKCQRHRAAGALNRDR